MRLKTGRAEQIFKVYPTTGGNRGRDSLKKLARHRWRFKRLNGRDKNGVLGFCSKFGQKKLSVKFLGKVGITFFFENFFVEKFSGFFFHKIFGFEILLGY